MYGKGGEEVGEGRMGNYCLMKPSKSVIGHTISTPLSTSTLVDYYFDDFLLKKASF